METKEKIVKISKYQKEKQLSELKQTFISTLSTELGLIKVEGPLIVEKGTGINDDLNGIEKPVAFKAKDLKDKQLEVVQSLAKWKRLKLAQIGAEAGQGVYVDMRALRPDEDLSNIHSIYVDQWDWEKVIRVEDRNIAFLKQQVQKIYQALLKTEQWLNESYGSEKTLPNSVYFIHSEALLQAYPTLTPKEREDAIARKHGAVFIIGIGHTLSNGSAHDLRSPDYDDWSSLADHDLKGLNGDLIVWNPILERAFELSSMGIRVDEKALSYQLENKKLEERKALHWHQLLLSGKLPYTIGGGIGQSRLAMFLLQKSHIQEVQQSVWN
jgi:aspartate--ammonia ligase